MIPLSVPNISGNEWEYLKECLDTEWVSTAGKYVELFEEKIKDYTGSKYAVACMNGTSAIQVSLYLAGVRPGHEVIVPTLTFIAPVNTIKYNGASPIFMDADNYYNIDTEKTIQFIQNETVFKDGFTYNKKTNNKISAILPVHVWGNAVWLDELVPLCKERNIVIVEDASESLGTFYSKGEYLGKHTGTIGEFGCLSFNGNKIITTGGGGMILTNNEQLAGKARYLTTQAKDDPIRYIHNEVGFNFRLTNIQAALGVAQVEQLSKFINKRRNIFKYYLTALNDIEGFSIASVPEYASNNHWLNILKIQGKVNPQYLDNLIDKFEKNSIQTRPVWKLNHTQRPFKKYLTYKIELANDLVTRSLCLPSSSQLKNSEIEMILNTLQNNLS